MTDYKINDRNGETRIQGPIVPDPAFNGGTITTPLTVRVTDNNALQIVSDDGTAVWAFGTGGGTPDLAGGSTATSGYIFQLGSGGSAFTISADGDVHMDGLNGNSQWLQVRDADSTHHILLKTDAGLEIYPSAGNPLVVKSAAGASIFEVRADGSVHIKTGTSVIADL